MVDAVIVENGIVVNRVVVESEAFAQAQGWIISESARIGDSYSSGTFTTPEPDPEPVPSEVTMRQARLALRQGGLLASVNAAIAGLPEPDATDASIEWEYSQSVRRNQPFTQTLAGALELSEADLDGLFALAATL